MMRTRLSVALIGANVIAGALILLASCGGSEVISPGGGGTGSQVTTTSVGPITGFSSIIVNGVRYDDSTAVVTTDDARILSRSDLRLGMTVELRGTSEQVGGTGTASSIKVFSEVKGTVTSVSADELVVNGLRVLLRPSTIYDGISAVTVGDFIEVYGAFDPSANAVLATRVERDTPDDFKLRGVVSLWNAASQQFDLNGTTIDYSATTLPAGFGDGVPVRVYGLTAPNAGNWSVSEVRLASSDFGDDGDRAEIEGIITRFVNQSDFSVWGLPVDASGAVFKDGAAADLSAGQRIEVEGILRNGTLIAESIEFEDGDISGSGDGDDSFEVKGRVSNFVSIANFVVRNTRIDASQSPVFERGTASDLIEGACVEVKGDPSSDVNGSVVVATEVKFDDDCS